MSDYMVEETSGPVAAQYRGVVVAIHWISALLIVAQIWFGLVFEDYARGTPERAFYFEWHKTLGVLILLLAIVRLGVRLFDPPPPYPQDFPRWERMVAVWSHRALYFLMIALPLTGLMIVSKGGATTELVGGYEFPTIPLPAIGEAHEYLAYGMIGLLGLHVVAALYNQFVAGGEVVERMPPFGRKD